MLELGQKTRETVSSLVMLSNARPSEGVSDVHQYEGPFHMRPDPERTVTAFLPRSQISS